MKLLHTESPAGRAVELVADLVKQGRMSKAEARVIEDLVWHPEFPEGLRRPHVFIKSYARVVDAVTGRDLGSAD